MAVVDRDHTALVFAVIGPAFEAGDDAGDGAHAPGARFAWAAGDDLGGETDDVATACAAWAGRTLVLRDPLFEAAWLDAACAAAGLTPPPTLDWLLALAPFGQARRLAALLEEAEAVVPAPPGPRREACVLAAVYRLAAARAGAA